jgi:hypothetical protein
VLSSVQVLPKDLIPLDEREPEDAEKELRSIAREIAEVLRQAESAPPTRDAFSPTPARPPEQEGDQSTVDSDLLPLEEIERRYRFSPTARAVLDTARELAEGLSDPVPVASSLLLFAKDERERPARKPSAQTAEMQPKQPDTNEAPANTGIGRPPTSPKQGKRSYAPALLSQNRARNLRVATAR